MHVSMSLMYSDNYLENNYLLLSDNDLLNAFYRQNSESIWGELSYIQNKIPVQNYVYIKRRFNIRTAVESDIVQLTTESMLGILDEENLEKRLTENKYLDYLSLRIVNLLNFKHNIRVIDCEFCYVKCVDGFFWLVDVQHLSFSNLTPLIKRR